MSIRRGIWTFLGLFAVVSIALHVSSGILVERAVDPERLEASIRRANSQGERALASRLQFKGIFYSGEPKRFIGHSSGDPALENYAMGLRDHHEGHPREAESHFMKSEESDSPVLAALSKIRLEQIRYGTGIPHSEKIPF